MATRHPRDAFFRFSSTNVPLRRGRAFLAAKIPSRRSVSRQQGGATARDARDASPATFSIFVIHPIDVTWKNMGTSNGLRLPPPQSSRRGEALAPVAMGGVSARDAGTGPPQHFRQGVPLQGQSRAAEQGTVWRRYSALPLPRSAVLGPLTVVYFRARGSTNKNTCERVV